MTVITRVVRRVFLRRGKPGRARIWMRRRSTVWFHFDPPATTYVWCKQCDQVAPTSRDVTNTGQIVSQTIAKHRIGTAWIDGVTHAKFCDGTETPE